MDMKSMMKQARKMQAELEKAQEEAAGYTAEASAGGGVVKVIASGDQRIQSITIDPSVVDPEDVEMLQDLVLAAANDALGQVAALVNTRMNAITGGASLPF